MLDKDQTSINNLLTRISSLTKVKSVSQTLILTEQVTYLQTYQNLLYIGTNESKVLVYQITDSEGNDQNLAFTKVAQLYPHCTYVRFIVAVKDFLVVVPQQQQQLIRIWKRQSLQIMQGYKGHEKQITKVIFLKDGEHLASVSHDSTARIWGIHQHNQFDKQKYLFEGMYPLLALQQIDQNILALGGDDCCITLWDWKKQQVQCVVFGHPGSVYSLTYYYPYLVSSGGDSLIKIWQIKQESVVYSSRTVPEVIYQDRDELHLIKQIEGQVGHNQFFFKMPNYRMMILDSAGKILFINQKLEVTTQKFQIEYYKKIVSAQFWGQYLLFSWNQSEKSKKKQVNIVFLDYMNEENVVNGFSWTKNNNASSIVQNNQFSLPLLQARVTSQQNGTKKIEKNSKQQNDIPLYLKTQVLQINPQHEKNMQKESKENKKEEQSLQVLFTREHHMEFTQMDLNPLRDQIEL